MIKLSSELKESTKNAHQQLEKVLVTKLKGLESESDYVTILNQFYGYIQPVENNIARYISPDILPDYAERRKSAALLSDIKHLNCETTLPIHTDIPEIQNKYQAIGALYVLEGSTLGGQIISKMIREKLGFSHCDGLTFFTAYADKTMEMWFRFQHMLDSESIPRFQHQAVIEAANQTFIKFKHWLET